MTTQIGNKVAENFFGFSITPETAIHALKKDADGLLTYSKIKLNGSESIELSNGQGQAFDGMEEFVRGVTSSGVVHNTVQTGIDEVGQKALLGQDFNVKILNSTTNTPAFFLNNNLVRFMDLVKGATYRFITDDPTTQGYPLFIATTAGGGTDAEYLKGVTNSRSAYGGTGSDPNCLTTEPLVFTVPADAPDILYLSTGSHPTFYATIYTSRLTYPNLKYRNYDQTRLDDRKLTYFINSNGFLVARYNQDYTY
jgi:hypothetical protein